MAREDDRVEAKSVYTGSPAQQMELIKTIVAFANTRGGRIYYEEVTCDCQLLDSARIDDLVNKYVGPRLGGISSEAMTRGHEVRVDVSPLRPHLFLKAGNYRDDKGKDREAFHPGQLWVRHSSKTEPAVADDLLAMMLDSAGRLLQRLGMNPAATRHQLIGGAGAVGIRLSSEADAIPVAIDIERAYPYTTRTLGTALSRDQSWAAQASKRLGLKESRAFSYGLKGANGQVNCWRYSEEARARVLQSLQIKPDWNPYSDTLHVS